MGYTTYVTGEFIVTPPLTWNEFKDSPFAPHNIDDAWKPSLILRVDEVTIDTDEGPLHRRTASMLAMREISEYRAHGLVDEMQSAIDSFPGHTFAGRLDCEGEENTDIWRVVVRDGRAVRIEPRIVWPDEGEDRP